MSGHWTVSNSGPDYRAGDDDGMSDVRSVPVRSVPVTVLETLASAWEDLSQQGHVSKADAQTMRFCARMLREAIAPEGAN